MTVSTAIDDGVLVVTLDDGKMNAITHGVLEALHAALDTAKADAKAVCLRGNDRALSAGFDLAVMTGPPEGMRELVTAGAELLMRLYVHPQPTVVAVTGHALAGGALIALACDTRIGAGGPAKIGLNEIAIGLALPEFANELALARLSKRFLTRATIQAEIFDPAGAVAAGYLDRLDAACVDAAVAEARRLGDLPGRAYARTKRSLRQPMVDRVLAGIASDLAGLTVSRSHAPN
jgi:enoyl-CoA hydratase